MIFAIEQPPADSGGHIEEGYVADRGGGLSPSPLPQLIKENEPGAGTKNIRLTKMYGTLFV